MKDVIFFSRISNVNLPQYSSEGAAGIDFFHPNNYATIIPPGDAVLIPSGIKVNLPKDYSLIAFNSSYDFNSKSPKLYSNNLSNLVY